jgi:hypothetical protein
MKIKIMGKFKNDEWKEVDNADNEDDANYLMRAYKEELGQSWMLKKVIEDA